MALSTTDKPQCEATYRPSKEAYPEPQPGHVYVVSIPSYNRMELYVLAVFKRAKALERFFKGAMLAQARYQGHIAALDQVRGWYTVSERKVEA